MSSYDNNACLLDEESNNGNNTAPPPARDNPQRLGSIKELNTTISSGELLLIIVMYTRIAVCELFVYRVIVNGIIS